MRILSATDSLPLSTPTPIACAIGVYDGVHIGHQALIKQLHRRSSPKGTRCIVTFSPHPDDLLTARPTPLITSLSHRLSLFAHYGIDCVLILPFTQALAAQSYQAFISTLRSQIPFSYLVFGAYSALGNNREGTEPRIRELGSHLGFEVDYVAKTLWRQAPVSSAAIRTAIRSRSFKVIKKMLGRPYTIQAPYSLAACRRENETLYSWPLQCPGLCPLPQGIYAVDLTGCRKKTAAIAFVSSTTDLQGQVTLSLEIFFAAPPKETCDLDILFVDHLHDTPNKATLEGLLSLSSCPLSAQPT